MKSHEDCQFVPIWSDLCFGSELFWLITIEYRNFGLSESPYFFFKVLCKEIYLLAAVLFIPISFENFLKKRMCKRMSRENRVTWLPALERKALVLFSFFLFLDGLHVFYFTSVGSWITWFISSWEENNCYVTRSKFTR